MRRQRLHKTHVDGNPLDPAVGGTGGKASILPELSHSRSPHANAFARSRSGPQNWGSGGGGRPYEPRYGTPHLRPSAPEKRLWKHLHVNGTGVSAVNSITYQWVLRPDDQRRRHRCRLE